MISDDICIKIYEPILLKFINYIGSFHAKSTNFEQHSDMTIFDFAEIFCFQH